MNQIGTTTCIQPRQTELGDNNMIYAEIDLKHGSYARRIVNIQEYGLLKIYIDNAGSGCYNNKSYTTN